MAYNHIYQFSYNISPCRRTGKTAWNMTIINTAIHSEQNYRIRTRLFSKQFKSNSIVAAARENSRENRNSVALFKVVISVWISCVRLHYVRCRFDVTKLVPKGAQRGVTGQVDHRNIGKHCMFSRINQPSTDKQRQFRLHKILLNWRSARRISTC